MNRNFLDEDFKKSSVCSHCSHCVVVAQKEGTIAVRDTKDLSKQTLLFSKDEWQAFVDGVKRGEFDYL